MELLYLDQNYLSGIVKRKVAFRELEPALRAAVARGVVAVPESETHRLESAARPDLPLLALLRVSSPAASRSRTSVAPSSVTASGASRRCSSVTSPSAGAAQATGST
jgi:hypothetical protein